MHLRLLLTCSPEWAPQRAKPYPLCEGPLRVMCGVAQFQGLCVGWRSLPPALPHLGGGWSMVGVGGGGVGVSPRGGRGDVRDAAIQPHWGPHHTFLTSCFSSSTNTANGSRLLPANPPSTLAMCGAAPSLRLVHVEAASAATHDLRRAARRCLNLLSPRQTGRGIWTSCTGCKMDAPCRDDGSKPHGEVVWPANQPLNHPPAGRRLRA